MDKMFQKLLIIGTVLFLGVELSSSVRIETHRKMYQVVPTSQKQLETLYDLERKNPEVSNLM